MSSFQYGQQNVSSFPIGNGQIGLHLSSYATQHEGSAQAAAGRDVFLIFDPRSSGIFRGGIERGISKQRVRSQGCFSAAAEHYFLADINHDGLTNIGVIKEEIQCSERAHTNVDRVVGPFYNQHAVVWYVFKDNSWKLDPSVSGKFPDSDPKTQQASELPLIGMEKTPVDFVGCTVWQSCDKRKWPTGKKDQKQRQD